MSRVTPKIEARIRELKASGLSLRKVAEALGRDGVKVSHMTVQEVLRSPESPRASRVRERGAHGDGGEEGNAERSFPLAKSLAVHGTVGGEGEGDGPEAEILLLRDRLRTVRTLAEQAANGEDLSGFRDMTRLELELAGKLIALTPTKPVDPENDPASIERRDSTRARILDVVEDAERRRGDLCCRCMQHKSSGSAGT